jgi:hypothetical protein
MRTKVVKWVSIAALLLTVLFWSAAANFQLALNVVVSAAAVVVVVQAVQTKRYGWAAGFAALALLFNPAVPVFRLSGGFSLLLVGLSIAPFAVSLAALRAQPRLSVPSITDRSPGSESL